MNIQDALKETGMAIIERAGDSYAAIEDSQCPLTWYNKRTHNLVGNIALDTILSTNWQSYHKEKEIRPEIAGEVWKHKDQQWPCYIKYKTLEGVPLEIIIRNGIKKAITADMIHGKNGWTRLYPPVEDDNVERIEIEEVEWFDSHEGKSYPEYFGKARKDEFNFKDLQDRPPMKMILEIPKDE